jgi:hypothetical protein
VVQQVADAAGVTNTGVRHRTKKASEVIGEAVDLDKDSPAELKRKADKIAKAPKRTPHRKTPGSSRQPPLVKNGVTSAEQYAELVNLYPEEKMSSLSAILGKMSKTTAKRLFDLALVKAQASKVNLSKSDVIDPRLFWPSLPNGFCSVELKPAAKGGWSSKQWRDFDLEKFARTRGKWLDKIDQECGEMAARGEPELKIENQARMIWARPDPETKVVLASSTERPVPAGMIGHQVSFAKTEIWPRPEGGDKWRGIEVTERDVIVGWNLANAMIKRLEAQSRDDWDQVRHVDVARELTHWVNAMKLASSLDGLCLVIQECLDAYNAAKGDLSASVTPGPLTMLKTFDKSVAT